ncbi:MAG: diaminobutyrate--2-oxoglutarate transaminase [Gammaproteobacteria bacterium]|nr:diaminobutyrate--2-oxoglutarate transaminase [Gammaproteobacteria bacterium]NIN62429.1 diaminobutyrate--2-oxoglutarate transaminase [Gammaproteobacteria bacterium]NIO63024.1 diaminobutyrate--2-oxoglutarate transaminase [Gammaproteobacteria bacterium]NIP49029.1 diaminobutyrate--2-oxoglutarate transaminase [Gammaproteobacteria bacterium]NIQ09485.1 diaminobutyrate--2-oxoglutarate transaminase [Gammaproteobacteria bacterium]
MELFERLESNVRAYSRVFPVIFDKAKNAHQFDEAGNCYIDFFAGAGVLNFGHNNEQMKRALIDYLSEDRVTHSLDMCTTAKKIFMESFESIILKPRKMDYKMQFTGPTGTNVIEAALKLARKITGRRQVVAFTDGFHGMTLGSLACTGNQLFRNAAGVPLEHVTRVAFEGYANNGTESLDQLRTLYDDPSSGMTPPAAFLVETIQAEGGVNLASKEWLQALQSLTREFGSLLVIDDIQVGCGRTGRYFSFEGLDLDPDLICMAKGIGGYGTPMAMMLIKPEHDAWNPGEHTGTFRGQNLSFVAGTEALRYFENDKFLNEVTRKGKIIEDSLAKIVKNYSGSFCTVDKCKCPGKPPMKHRGRGMIHGLCVGNGKLAAAIVKTCFENKLIVASCGPEGRILKLIPPLTIEDKVLEEGLRIFVSALDELCK